MYVWQLRQRLVEQLPGEVKLLRRMLNSEDVSALLRAQSLRAQSLSDAAMRHCGVMTASTTHG